MFKVYLFLFRVPRMFELYFCDDISLGGSSLETCSLQFTPPHNLSPHKPVRDLDSIFPRLNPCLPEVCLLGPFPLPQRPHHSIFPRLNPCLTEVCLLGPFPLPQRPHHPITTTA